jgi:hypothetical protein
MNSVTEKTSCDILPMLQDIDMTTLSCLAGDHGAAVAIAILFAFLGAVFLAPSVVK